MGRSAQIGLHAGCLACGGLDGGCLPDLRANCSCGGRWGCLRASKFIGSRWRFFIPGQSSSKSSITTGPGAGTFGFLGSGAGCGFHSPRCSRIFRMRFGSLMRLMMFISWRHRGRLRGSTSQILPLVRNKPRESRSARPNGKLLYLARRLNNQSHQNHNGHDLDTLPN